MKYIDKFFEQYTKEYEELKTKYEKLIQVHNEVLSVLQQFGLNIQIVASQNKVNQ